MLSDSLYLQSTHIYVFCILKVVEDGRKPYLPTWFPGARLNYAENLLSRNDDSIAVTAARETGDAQHYSWRELRRQVAEVAAGLRNSGVRVGDRVAGMSYFNIKQYLC